MSPCQFPQPQAARGRAKTSGPSGECLEILEMSQCSVMTLWAVLQTHGVLKVLRLNMRPMWERSGRAGSVFKAPEEIQMFRAHLA